jgi:hypothetical protein
MEWKGSGLLGKAARNVRNGDVDTNGDGGGVSGGDEVDNNV